MISQMLYKNLIIIKVQRKRVFPKINMDKIKKFIDNIECISSIRKDFYKKMIEQRYYIIKDVYENINSKV